MFHTGERLGLERRDPMRKRQGLTLKSKRQGLTLERQGLTLERQEASDTEEERGAAAKARTSRPA